MHPVYGVAIPFAPEPRGQSGGAACRGRGFARRTAWPRARPFPFWWRLRKPRLARASRGSGPLQTRLCRATSNVALTPRHRVPRHLRGTGARECD